MDLLRRLPIYPMFGQGKIRLQPAFVEDVAQAIAAVTQRPEACGKVFECAGPRVYTYEELLRTAPAGDRPTWSSWSPAT